MLLISFYIDIAKNTFYTCAHEGSSNTMYQVVSKLNWHRADISGLEARKHTLWEGIFLPSSEDLGCINQNSSNIIFNYQD